MSSLSLSRRILRQGLKKSERESHGKNSKRGVKSRAPYHAEEDVFEVIDQHEEVKYNLTQTISDNNQSSSSFSNEEMVSSLKWQNHDEQQIFEDQLNKLQDQLMVAMVENQTLKNELQSKKIKMELEKVKTELEIERHHNELLEKKLQDEFRKKMQKPGAGKENSGINKSSALGDTEAEPPKEESVPAKRRFYQTRVQWLMSFLYAFLDDFKDEPVANNAGDPDGSPLTVKLLKENIKRFGSEAKPYVSTFKGICDLLAWKSPPYTLIVLVVYMYSLWKGWWLSVFLLCLSFRLFISFLRYRQWNVCFNFFDVVEDIQNVEEKDLNVSEECNLVMQVARKVQNFLGEAADSLEKVKSLLTWRHPVASQRLLITVTAAFITSCFIPTAELFFYAGLILAIRLFIINYIFNLFPRVRRKYDSAWRLWKELPTSIEYDKRNARSEIDKYIFHCSQEKRAFGAHTKSDHISGDDQAFRKLFSLPESECPLPGWQGGRRCTLINKEKSLTSAFKNGKLYLTASFLCFERTKTASPKNIVIPLSDIVRLEKAKPYGWLPGGGMAIEIAIVGNNKPYIFGTIINRDDIFDGILMAGRKSGLSWSMIPSLTE